jgi:hypothetical protein
MSCGYRRGGREVWHAVLHEQPGATLLAIVRKWPFLLCCRWWAGRFLLEPLSPTRDIPCYCQRKLMNADLRRRTEEVIRRFTHLRDSL